MWLDKLRSESSPVYEGIKTIKSEPLDFPSRSESSPVYEGIKTQGIG
ncbi:hypothetical protein BPUTEOMOX_2 [methanotrophic endosymbiont of Bathymodiolus puteoserpentis (Logatchev)]|nr:hypothetical protein BPUTEOMOX_2 [methanotrophic endosymbiont of Bathymodiolus puteoserpentis (Logatchev)]